MYLGHVTYTIFHFRLYSEINYYPTSKWHHQNIVPFLGINGRRASLFCGLRRFTRCTEMPNGYRADARSNLYLPFHLTLSFRDLRDLRDRTTEQQFSNRAMFLVVTAQPVHSAYKGSMVQGLR